MLFYVLYEMIDGVHSDLRLFRTLNLKMPLTSASFSPEGTALYFGTENGKLLIVDLRMLDKAPQCINISEGGCRVQCMSFQVYL